MKPRGQWGGGGETVTVSGSGRAISELIAIANPAKAISMVLAAKYAIVPHNSPHSQGLS